MAKLLDYLYIGSLDDARNNRYLQSNNIKYIINLCDSDNFPVDVKCYNFPIRDDESQDIIPTITKCIKIIDSVKHKGNILVHCYAGISRSATCVIAYIMYTFNWPVEQAYRYVKTKRVIINPNIGFLQQLYQFESSLNLDKNNMNDENKSSNKIWVVFCIIPIIILIAWYVMHKKPTKLLIGYN